MNGKRVHHFHAEATALHAQLQHPLTQEIKPQNFVKLPKGGGYLSEHARDYRVENVVSYKSAHTHVAGHKSPKPGHGWVTLTTSSIENFNVLEVVTADRVVSQIATEHPLEGHVPTVTFLGTRFENLKVAGVDVKFTLNPELLFLKPQSPDKLYLEDADFLTKMGSSASFPDLHAQWQKYHSQDPKGSPKPAASVTGTLATGLSAGPWKVSGNVIEVPEFGKIILAELIVDCDTFHLTMIRLEMGCIAGGSMSAGIDIVNGTTKP
jgi:hypothetical protein